LLVVFGMFILGTDLDPYWLDLAMTAAGLAIALSAVGAVELGMALYDRTRTSRRSRRHS